jgi:hypothetical protein
MMESYRREGSRMDKMEGFRMDKMETSRIEGLKRVVKSIRQDVSHHKPKDDFHDYSIRRMDSSRRIVI